MSIDRTQIATVPVTLTRGRWARSVAIADVLAAIERLPIPAGEVQVEARAFLTSTSSKGTGTGPSYEVLVHGLPARLVAEAIRRHLDDPQLDAEQSGVDGYGHVLAVTGVDRGREFSVHDGELVAR